LPLILASIASFEESRNVFPQLLEPRIDFTLGYPDPLKNLVQQEGNSHLNVIELRTPSEVERFVPQVFPSA